MLAAWRWLEASSRPALLGLVLVMAMQLLAGHFQFAFYTCATVLALGLAAIPLSPLPKISLCFRAILLPVALLGASALAAVQLLPSAELMVWADWRGHGLDYLASFTTHPLFLVNYLAPTLLHLHPLWEPVIWEPWRSSPAACLPYVGLIPLCLALYGAVGCRDKEETRARIWCVILFFSVLLSLGPYLLGFRWLAAIPGFDLFSATARWSMVSGLFLGLLAGRGLERIDPDQFPVWCRRFTGVAVLTLAIASVGLVALASLSGRYRHPPDRYHGLHLGPKLVDYGYAPQDLLTITPAKELGDMLRAELAFPIINLTLLALVSFRRALFSTRQRWLTLFMLWTAIDLSVVVVLLQPLVLKGRRSLVNESPVLRRIADGDFGRIGGTLGYGPVQFGQSAFGNAGLPDMRRYWFEDEMLSANVWGTAIPTMPTRSWRNMASWLGRSATEVGDDELQFMRMTDIRLLVHGPDAWANVEDQPLALLEKLTDPWLSEQLYGQGVNELSPANAQWKLWQPQPQQPSSRAWTFSVRDPVDPGSDPRLARAPPPARRRMLDHARMAEVVSDTGEEVIVGGTADGACVLVISDMFYPGWNAELRQNSATVSVPIEEAFGGWRAVFIPDAGAYEVKLTFNPASFRLGLSISCGAFAFWIGGCLVTLTSLRLSTLFRRES